MIDTLKLVSGAVSTKDLLPVLTHFCLYNGRIQGANGRVAIDAACPELTTSDIVVPAEHFLRAVDTCKGEPVFKINDDRTRLRISRGRFRATVPLLPLEDYPREDALPDTTDTIALSQPLLPVLRLLQPFVSEDASRPWSCSILLRNGYAYATNNVVLTRAPYAWNGPALMLTVAAIDELLRIDQEPLGLAVTKTACFALYKNSWLKAQLLHDRWPDSLSKLIERLDQSVADLAPLPVGLFDDIMLLAPFFPDPKLPVVLTGDEGVSTQDGLHSAAVDGGPLPKAAFRIESLSAVLKVATHMNIAAYPDACAWRGDGIEGLLSGVRI